MLKENLIKIAIIEDIKEVAMELREILNGEEGFQCQQLYHNAEDAINFLPQSPPDIVLVDIGLPRQSGIEAIQAITIKNPDIQFCMFTVFDDAEKIYASLSAGAKGYILKNSPIEKIISSIRELYEGGSPMNPSIARKVIEAFSAPKPRKSTEPMTELTLRENELLAHLSKGLLYKEIADQLGITTGTVKQHIHKIYHKLQVNNKTEAINKFHNRG